MSESAQETVETIGDVDLVRPCVFAQFRCGLTAQIFVEVEYCDAAALFDDHFRRCAAQTRGAARDDGHFVFQLHVAPAVCL